MSADDTALVRSATVDLLAAAGVTVGPVLGTGATGTVRAASLGDDAGFVLKSARADSPGAHAALRNEVQALQRIGAIATGVPHLVRVLETPSGLALLLAPRGTTTLVEWVRGDAEDLVPGAVTTRAVTAIIATLARTLASVHAHGVVHGDLSPANVVLGSGHPCLIDFGAATIDGRAPEGLRGTLPYTAPEILTGAPCRPDTDRYALAQVAVELLTGAATPRHPLAARRVALADHGVAEPLADLLVAAGDPDPAARPDHAAWLTALTPDPETPSPRRTTADRAPGRLVVTREFGPRPPAAAFEPAPQRSRVRVPLLAGAASVVVGTLVTAGAARGGAPAPTEPGHGPPAPVATTVAPSPARPSERTASFRWDPVRAEATVDDEGGTRRFQIGAPGDQLVVGRWHCTGDPRPVLYRPSTGDLYEFPGWATDRPEQARPTGGHGPRDGTLRRAVVGACDVPLVDPPASAPAE